MEVIQRYSVLSIGVLFCGLLGALAAHWLLLPTGGPAPGFLEAQSPVIAAGIVCMLLAIATVIAGGVARFSNAAVGLFTLGAGVFVLSRRSGTVLDLVFSGSGLGLVVLETLIWAGVILLATMAIFTIGGPLRDIEPDESGHRPHWLLSREAMICAAMGAIVLPGVWMIGQSMDKGQAVAAVFLGSLGAGLAGRLISPHVQPILLFASPCVFGAIGHVIGMVMTGGPVEDAVITGTLSSLNTAMPVDYAAGSLLGVSVGLGWARSMLQHEDEPDGSS